MKKLIALLLAMSMVFALVACGNNGNNQGNNGGNNVTDNGGKNNGGNTDNGGDTTSDIVTFEGDYTYLDWVSTLSANWNIHDYETSDQAYPIDYLVSGLYTFIFNDELNPVEGRAPYEGYVIVPEMAAELPIDVTEQIAAEGKWEIPEGATSGYAYTIKLNPNAKFEDGTPITADDYVESMKRLLDPKLQNFRATGYFQGSFCISGAEAYYNQGKTVTTDNGISGTIADIAADLTKNADGVYCLADGTPVYLAIGYGIDWLNGNSLADYVNAYGAASFAMETWDALYAMVDENGKIALTDEALALFLPVITGNPAWGETEDDAVNYLIFDQTYPEIEYDGNVALYKTGEHEITFVLNKSLAGFNLLYNLTSNWLVKTDLYDSCIKEETTASGTIWTSTYCTSVETTCSYGPYKMTSYQTDKGMHFVKNENWHGYTDGKHVYVDPVDGLTYPMYMTTEVDCVVVSEVATAKLMFLKGELMQYGLQEDDFDAYRNSDYCHFTPGQAVFFLLLNGNMEQIKTREAAEDFDQTAYDLETLTLLSFHRAMGLAYDKDLYCENRSPADSGAFGLIGHAYISDPEVGTKYRDTEAAKKVLCEVYGVDVSKYASLDDAVDSITGYDPVAAKEWFVKAYNEAMELGYITDANNDGICDQTIQLTYSASAVSDKLSKNLEYLTTKANEVTAGTPFEGKISFVASAPLGNEWSNKVKSGECDTCLAGWTGSAMDPFGLIEVYTNPNSQYDAAWFDSTTVDMTLTIEGEEITMNLDEWTKVLNGSEINGYNFGDGMASNDVRVEILAGLEKAILLQYNNLPFIEDGSMALLTQKAYYVVEEYNPVMGRGGIAYLRYAYNDAEWAAYVAECGGELTY